MKDILLDNNFDLQVATDLVVGEGDAQIAAFVLEAATGEYKEAPLVGASARTMLGGCIDPFWRGRVKSMLQSQHIEVKKFEIKNDEINIEL